MVNDDAGGPACQLPSMSDSTSLPRLALSAVELAGSLGICVRHLRRMDSIGRLPRAVRLGRTVRWSVDDIRDWLLSGAPDRRCWDVLKRDRSR